MLSNSEKYISYIRWSFILLMIGLSYQHFFWNTPYLSLVSLTGIYIKSSEIISIINQETIYGRQPVLISKLLGYSIGLIFLLSAIFLWKGKKTNAVYFIIRLACYGFLFYILLDFINDSFYIPHLLEKSARIASVLLIYLLLFICQPRMDLIIWIIKISLVFTFIFHGLFALNFFPVPCSFIEMTMSILKTSAPNARGFLAIVGVLDILFSFGLFIHKVEKVAFLYMIIWGFLTALARIVAHFSIEIPFLQFHRWTFEFLIRTPHFLLPVTGIILSKQNVKTINGSKSLRQNTTA